MSWETSEMVQHFHGRERSTETRVFRNNDDEALNSIWIYVRRKKGVTNLINPTYLMGQVRLGKLRVT